MIYVQYSIIEEQMRNTEGGKRILNAIRADQTRAIKKIARNYRYQAENIRRARRMILSSFPAFLWNPWLELKTRILLAAFLSWPGLFYRLYNRLKRN